jgi:hypothetical protein
VIKRILLPLLLAFLSLGMPHPAAAAGSCGHVVIATLPSVTWQDIESERPPNILAAVGRGAAGSISVRTDSPVTTYASGFTTLGAGARAEGGIATGGEAGPQGTARNAPLLRRDVVASGISELTRLARSSDYHPVPGALGEALGDIPSVAIGNADVSGVGGEKIDEGRWTLLAAMDTEGRVDRAATGLDLLRRGFAAPFGVRTDGRAMDAAISQALRLPCSVLFVDGGDLIRREQAALAGQRVPPVRVPLLSMDGTIGYISKQLDPRRDLLLLVSPTSPAADPLLHLGVAVAVGRGFAAGSSLTSPSTGAPGLVTLPDVAPTVLGWLGLKAPSAMVGRAWYSVGAAGDRVAGAAELDSEARFAHTASTFVSGAFGVAELALVLGAAWVFRRRWGGGEPRAPEARVLEVLSLAALSFPLAIFLVTPLNSHELGLPLTGAAMIAGAALITGLALVVARDPLRRALFVCAITLVVLAVDVILGARLQAAGFWGNDPILGGRFTGLGNRGFAVLGSCSILTAALVFDLGRDRWARWVAAAIFALTIVVDGAPGWGSDVGGVLALVPTLGLTLLLLTGRKISIRTVVLAALAAAAVLGAFVWFDLSRSPDQQTHLARLVLDIRDRGFGELTGTIGRKLRANLGVFTSSYSSYLIPPIAFFVAWLVLRGGGRWPVLAAHHPDLRTGLVGGLLLALFGFAINDSGVIVVAVTLSVLAPAALLFHLGTAGSRA